MHPPAPVPAGELTALPRPLAGFKGPITKDRRERQGRGEWKGGKDRGEDGRRWKRRIGEGKGEDGRGRGLMSIIPVPILPLHHCVCAWINRSPPHFVQHPPAVPGNITKLVLCEKFGAYKSDMLTCLILLFATGVCQADCELSNKETAYPTLPISSCQLF